MRWYKIDNCPNYAVSEYGHVVNIKTQTVIKHNVTNYAKDGLRRVALSCNKTFMGKTRAYKKVFVVKTLVEEVRKEENLIFIDESKFNFNHE